MCEGEGVCEGVCVCEGEGEGASLFLCESLCMLRGVSLYLTFDLAQQLVVLNLGGKPCNLLPNVIVVAGRLVAIDD